MAKFSPNPLKWFKKRRQGSAPQSSGSPALLKSSALPRKSGDIFMHLITIQKSLKSMELAIRQQVDHSWLLQKITGQVAILRLEAEAMEEEELAGVAGQAEAFFETVLEGRLDFDEKGLAIMIEFTNIFKDSFGDTVSKKSSINERRLEAWDTCYQALMANMMPTIEETPAELPTTGVVGSVEDAEPEEESHIPEPAVEAVDESPVLDVEEYPAEEEAPAGFEVSADSTHAYIDDEEETAEQFVDEEEGKDPPYMPEEWTPEEEIPDYDQSRKVHEPDAVISDAEIKSAREYMELGESRPEIGEPDEEADLEIEQYDDELEMPEKSPVRLQEVQFLKNKLSELHEEQENLSAKMSDILGEYKEAVQTAEAMARESEPVEDLNYDLDITDLEDIIFIGRQKG